MIGDNGYSSFTNFKSELKVSTGTIYHHLDTLSQLIEQKEDKKYYLTDLGVLAYNSLKDNINSIITPDFSSREFKSPLLKALMKLTPRKAILLQEEKKHRILFYSVLCIILGSIFTGLNQFLPFFLFFYKSNLIIFSSEIMLQVIFSILFIANSFLYYIILEGICRIFYKKNENSFNFFQSFGLIFFPIDLFLVIHFIFEISGSIVLPSIRIIDNILMILFQVWSLWLLTYSLTVNKQLKIEGSLIIVLLIHYSGFSIFLLLSI